jgi:nitrate reductase alpha subunit
VDAAGQCGHFDTKKSVAVAVLRVAGGRNGKVAVAVWQMASGIRSGSGRVAVVRVDAAGQCGHFGTG